MGTIILTRNYLMQLSQYTEYDGMDLQMKPPKPFIALREKARSYAAQAVVASGKVPDKALRAMALFLRANVLTWCFMPEKALSSAVESSKLFQESGNEQMEAASLAFCIDLHLVSNNIEQAKECAETALQIARDMGDAQLEEEILDAWQRVDDKEFGVVEVKEYVAQVQQSFDMPGMDMMPQGGGGGGGSVAAFGKAKLDPVATGKKLMELVSSVMAGDEEVQQDSPLMEAGMDSLSSVQFVNEVSREFQMSFSPSLVFDFPTVSALADHIIEAASG